MSLHPLPLAAALLASAAGPVFACATCGCALSSDAAMGYSTETGWRASLQVDYIDQDQLRYGAHTVSAARIAQLNEAGADQEIEHDTVNRYITFGLSYAPNADWNAKALFPYIDRGHSTYGSATDPLSADQLSGAKITGLGDVRLLGTWQGLLPEKNLGLQLGIKLPTGHYGGPNAEGSGQVGHRPTSFRSGPIAANAAPDNLVDTSLQPGTGTTDLLLGAFYHQPVSRDVDAFANLQFQTAVAQRLDAEGADFRPGNTTIASIGARYLGDPRYIPQLQVNVAHKGADQGALADNPDSAGTIVYLSPGATFSLSERMQVFGFAQWPVHLHLVGYQLAPRWTASAGLTVGF